MCKPVGIPTWLITGFLGSGKTTLVNHLLRCGFGGERVAVVVNDFGKVAVDAELLRSASGDDMLALPNGCICCTIQGALIDGLKKLLDSYPFDRVVIETSGVTDPAAIARILGAWPLDERTRLDLVVCVAHAVRHAKVHGKIRTVDEQVRYADVVLLNHCDEADADQRRITEEAIRAVNQDVTIMPTTLSAVDPPVLAGYAKSVRAAIEAHEAHEVWKTWSISFDTPPERAALSRALGALPEGVLRVKGFVPEVAGGALHVERVGMDLNMETWDRPLPKDSRNVLIAIGGASAEEFESAFTGLAGVRIAAVTHTPHEHGH